MALGVASMVWREETKQSLSVQDAQAYYFEAIENKFGDLIKMVSGTDLTPDQVAEGLVRDDEMVAQGVKIARDFVPALTEFWKEAHDPVSYNLTDSDAAKGVFGGDLFPLGSKSIASTCGLYLDTIILADPFMNSKVPFDHLPDREAAKYFFKHGLNVSKYRDLALAETDVPMLAIIPFESAINPDHRNVVAEASLPDCLAHAKRLFSRDFADLDELAEFCGGLETFDDLSTHLKDPKRLLFDTTWTDPLDVQVGKALAEIAQYGVPPTVGNLILNQCFGRMMQANDVLLKSNSLRGAPLIEAPTSWAYFNWMLEYGSKVAEEEKLSLHMTHGLQYAGQTDLQWLGKIPHQALIEMRQKGALDEVRSALQHGVLDIAQANGGAFFRTADKVVDNIEEAYRQHRKMIDDLAQKKWEFWGHDIGSWLVTGSIGVAAALFAQPGLALGALAADQLLDAPKLRDLPRKFVEVRDGQKRLANSPLGLFFAHRH